MNSHYADRIAPLTSHDPRHVEAWMRLEHGTLDHLSPAAFDSEVCIANECVAASTARDNDALAHSYGL